LRGKQRPLWASSLLLQDSAATCLLLPMTKTGCPLSVSSWASYPLLLPLFLAFSLYR
jgi:hypothetical protein